MEGDTHLLLIGVNHRTAGLDLREALAFTREECVQLLAAVVASGAAEALVVSTCNRTEFYVADATTEEADRRVRRCGSQRQGHADGMRRDPRAFVRSRKAACRS